MKTFTRVIAVVMMVALLASLMVACGAKKEENHIDNNLVGTWTQTSESDGNWTWTFNSDGTCKLVGDDNFDSSGTGQPRRSPRSRWTRRGSSRRRSRIRRR